MPKIRQRVGKKIIITMKTASFYRAQAREVLKDNWGKSALATLAFSICIMIPSFIVVIGANGFESDYSAIWLVLALVAGFGVVPFSFSFCTAFLSYSRNKATNLLKETWNIGLQNYGRYLGAVLLIYLMIFAIYGVIGVASSLIGSCDSLIMLIIYILVLLWLLILMFQLFYGYRLVPYLINDNPTLTAFKALKESNKQMKGYKRVLLLLDLSVMQWYLYAFVGALVFVIIGDVVSSTVLLIISGIVVLAGLIGMLFLYPYILTASALFYEDLKNENTQQSED